ncbi:MAG: isochorismatase family protein [Limimaricola sp.]|uniref:isochorismatase family protein n=1 Tax=Limimaricola sp. TaxID=2211665 RepID=UPI001D3D673B|nr:isochorismatase family protein [Limimaricola sp.]MBI1417752.1 isochorismatase family protein [Limimaricola sp.]
MATALLVIDAQCAFFDGFGDIPPIPNGAEVLSNINRLIGLARGADRQVIFLRHCEDGSEFDPAAASFPLHPDLDRQADDLVIDKTRPNGFFGTDLAENLTKAGITALVVAGNQSDFCVSKTTRAALERGIAVTLAADAHGTWDNDGQGAGDIVAACNAALAEAGADVRASEAIHFG